jgi:hypothetical protein
MPHCCPFAESLPLLLCRTPIPQCPWAGAPWSIGGLSSRLLNKSPANGGPKFYDPAACPSSRAAKEFGNSSHYRKNSGGVAASARMRRNLMTAPFLQCSEQIKITSMQTKSPGSGRGQVKADHRPSVNRRAAKKMASAQRRPDGLATLYHACKDSAGQKEAPKPGGA